MRILLPVAILLAVPLPALAAGTVVSHFDGINARGDNVFTVVTGAAGPLSDVRFAFGGPNVLSIVRIAGVGGIPEFTFHFASLQDATRFFHEQPFHSAATEFEITVANDGDGGERLTVVTRWG